MRRDKKWGAACDRRIYQLVPRRKKAHHHPVRRDVHMKHKVKMTGRLIAAARALTGISLEDFAGAAGMPAETITLMEASGSARLNSESDIEAVSLAFERFGVVVIEEDASMGAGVRLKFTRQDVKQISRLESEGGIVGSDDAP
jgi:transcriptional regulator with XRE-family HTH domain